MDIANACSYDLTALAVDCDVKPQIGIDSVVICNAGDILPYEEAITDPSLTDTTHLRAFSSSASGFGMVDLRSTPFDGSSKTTEEGTVAPSTTKTLQFLFFVNDYRDAKTLDELKRGRFVVVAKHSGAGTGPGQKYEIMGYEVPMRCTAAEKTLAAADTNGANYGAYLITLSTSEMTDTLFFTVATGATYAAETTAYEALGAH